ncbi:hypothetical protein AC630_37640 [Bradyrhizobium sp. AS23.2]|nr:hypothetical protein AC630_37640 [Bradyrhizobium sp. AS23.2]
MLSAVSSADGIFGRFYLTPVESLFTGQPFAIVSTYSYLEVVGYFCLVGAFISWLVGRAVRRILSGT